VNQQCRTMVARAETPESAYRAGWRDSAELGAGRAYSGIPGSLKLGMKYIVGNEILD